MAPIRTISALALSLAAAACAPARWSDCAPTERRTVSDVLYLGMVRPSGVVTSAERAHFLETSVTPRFPQGLTVWQASGQWKGADGAVTREPSFVLNLVHAGDEPSDAAIRAIISEYKSRFNQEAVLRVRSPACISF